MRLRLGAIQALVQLLLQTRTGAPESVIELVQAKGRAPGPGELGLEILAAPIHPIDLLRTRGHYPLALPLPGILGTEGVARVTGLGPGVAKNWKPGDLCLLPPRFGSYRSHANLGASQAIPLPAQIDPVQASMLIINPLSADLLLDRCAKAGADAFVNLPASGAVGQSLLALAKVRKMSSINLVRSERWATWLHSIDPTATIEHIDDWTKRRDGPTPRIALDGVGGEAARDVARRLQCPGTLHVYGAASKRAPDIAIPELIFKGLSVSGFWLHRWMREQSQAIIRARIAKLAARMVDGSLKIKVAKTYPLAEYKQAFAAARDPQTFGKVILLPTR